MEEQDYLAHHGDGFNVALQLFQMRAGKVQARREYAMDDPGLGEGALYAAVLDRALAPMSTSETKSLCAIWQW